MKKNDFVGSIYCEELKTNVKGFFSQKNIEALKSDTFKGYVFQGTEYRPDKLAAYYMGDEKLGWLLTLVNEFDNGIKDYYFGREILIPTRDAVMKLKLD